MNIHGRGDGWAEREQRLHEIRREAKETGKAPSIIEPQNGASVGASPQTGYYGMPALKRPQWTVEVPIYFFVGGMAGAAALIATVGQLSSADSRLIRHSRWLAAVGGLISPALLIADLGMPSRFLNMLRVFKIQSPMSVGSWTLVAFSNSAAAAAVLGELEKRRPNSAIRVLGNGAQIVSALTGLILSTYTGVLIGATATPLWNEHVSTLPIHFAASGVASSVSLLELAGNESKALNRIAIGAALAETAMGASIEVRRTASTKPLRHGISGWAMRGAGLLSGPLPLTLRLIASFTSGSRTRRRNLQRAAAVSSLLGSFLTRFAWVHVGKVSADDPSVPLQLEWRSSPGDPSKHE
jgi:formate-dependent nitrite reductase membrane component NrfD